MTPPTMAPVGILEEEDVEEEVEEGFGVLAVTEVRVIAVLFCQPGDSTHTVRYGVEEWKWRTSSGNREKKKVKLTIREQRLHSIVAPCRLRAAGLVGLLHYLWYFIRRRVRIVSVTPRHLLHVENPHSTDPPSSTSLRHQDYYHFHPRPQTDASHYPPHCTHD